MISYRPCSATSENKFLQSDALLVRKSSSYAIIPNAKVLFDVGTKNAKIVEDQFTKHAGRSLLKI